MEGMRSAVKRDVNVTKARCIEFAFERKSEKSNDSDWLKLKLRLIFLTCVENANFMQRGQKYTCSSPRSERAI